MHKVKGQALHDKFYYKVQSEIVNNYVCSNQKPVVALWNEHSYFITPDRAVFYIIPKDKYCLSQDFIYPVSKLYKEDIQYVSELYPGIFELVFLTGSQFAINQMSSDKAVKLEVMHRTQTVYIMESHLSLFPKQKILCMKSMSDSPVFILSSLKTVLGGVLPLK